MNKLAALLAKLSALSNTAKVAVAVGSVAVVGTTAVTVNYVVEDQKEQTAIQEVMDTIETAFEEKFSLENSTITIEYGTSISSDLSDYVELSAEIMKDITFNLDVEDEEGKEYPAVGEYEASITYNKKKYPFTIYVKDTTAPKFTSFTENVKLEEGDVDEDLRIYYLAEDLSEVEILVNGTYDLNTPGDYTLEVVAKDKHGNETKQASTLSVLTKQVASSQGISKTDTPDVNQTIKNKEEETTGSGQWYGYDTYAEWAYSDDYIPPTPEEVWCASAATAIFATLDEAVAWVKETVADPNSEWYGRSTLDVMYIYRSRINGFSCEKDPVEVVFD